MLMSKRKFLSIAILSMLLLTTGCANEKKPLSQDQYQVTVVNRSEASVHEISYETQSSGGGGINADNSMIAYDDSLTFDFQTIGGSALWSVLDEDRKVLVSQNVAFTFDEENEMMLYILPDEKGIKLETEKP